MARPSNPEIRARLREQAVDYVFSHGAADLTLRPLAKALKTNARMLIYHFGSREGLMREILVGIRERGDALIQDWFGKAKTPPTLVEFLLEFWQRMSDPRMRAVARLIFELYALALRDPRSYPGVLTDPIRYWRRLAARTGTPPQTGRSDLTKTGRSDLTKTDRSDLTKTGRSDVTKTARSKAKAENAEATLLLAATRGLLLDLCATGDRRRVTQALHLLAQLLELNAKK